MNLFKIDALNNLLIQFFHNINNTVATVLPDKNVSYGLSIIILTVIIRALLSPLNVKQIRSSVMMGKVAPEMKKLQAKYKNDPKKLNEETMKIYKEKGINPLSGCLPLLLQWPILIALYYVFSTLNIKGIGFLWIHDLSKSATLSDWNTLILPVVSGATTYMSGMMMSVSADKDQAKQTKTMNIVMSVMLFWMSFTVNAALVLYWVTGNLIMLIQNKIIMKMVNKSLEKQEEESKIAKLASEEQSAADENENKNDKAEKPQKKTRRERRLNNNSENVKADDSSNNN